VPASCRPPQWVQNKPIEDIEASLWAPFEERGDARQSGRSAGRLESIDCYRWPRIRSSVLRYPILLHGTPRHSHSIVPGGLHHPVHPLHLVDDPGRNRCHRRMAPHVRFEFQTANYKGRVSSARWIRLRVAAARNARVMHQMCPSENRGRREDRVPTAPMVRVQQKSTRQNHRYRRIIRPSLRDGFNGFLRALSGDHAWLPPSPARRVSISANLAPASERQDHTTSPSAAMPLVVSASPASTASRPTFVTTRTPLLPRRDEVRQSQFRKNRNRKLFALGLDDTYRIDPACKLRF
jgi:hypothetical protein